MIEIVFDSFENTLKEVNLLKDILEKENVSKKQLQKGIIKANSLLFSNFSHLSIFAETVKSEVSIGYKIKLYEKTEEKKISIIEAKIIYNKLLSIIDSKVGKQIIQPKESLGIINQSKSLKIYYNPASIKSNIQKINNHSEINDLSLIELSENLKGHLEVIKVYLQDILLYNVFFIFAELDLDFSKDVLFVRDLNKEYIDRWVNCNVTFSDYRENKSIDHWAKILKLKLDYQTIQKIVEHQKKLFDEELNLKVSSELEDIKLLNEDDKKIVIENHLKLIEEFFKGNITKITNERLKNILRFKNSNKVLLAYDNLKKDNVFLYEYLVFSIGKFGYSPIFAASFFIKYLEKLKENFNFSKEENIIPPTVSRRLKNKPQSKHQSFTYINNLTGQTQLTDLMNALKLKNLIENSTDLKDFRKAFSGEAIVKPITWTGNISELSYFIKQLHNELKLVVNLKQQQWSVTINCFIQENGEQYDRKKLRTQKVPTTSKNIDSALNTLKYHSKL